MSELVTPQEAPPVHRGRRPGRRWVPVARGLQRGPHATALHAWQLVLPPSGAFSHLTAAGLHGWWLPALPPGLPVLVDQAGADHRTRLPGVRVTRTAGPVPAVEIGGPRVASAPQVLLACARDVGPLDLVVLLDSALRSGCAADDVAAACTPRRRGVVALRTALGLADPRSLSAWETVLRVMHVTLGAVAVPQHRVPGPSGAPVARGDLWLEGTRARGHDDAPRVRRSRPPGAAQHAADLRRDRALTAAGWTRRGYVAADLRDRPMGVLRDIDAALGREHDPARVRPWLTLLADSTFTPAGRARLTRRLTRL